VIVSSAGVKFDRTGGYGGTSSFWSQGRNPRWVHTLSHRVVVICTTEYTSAVARWCITRGLHTAGAEDRWKKFLSLVSPATTLSGSDPMRGRSSIE